MGALRVVVRLGAARLGAALTSDSPPSSLMKSSSLLASARFLRTTPSAWRPVRRLAAGAGFLAASFWPRAGLRPAHGCGAISAASASGVARELAVHCRLDDKLVSQLVSKRMREMLWSRCNMSDFF